MLLRLPTFNATLNPCPVSPATFMPHADGGFCGSCQRVVQDFSRSANPLADLASARAASPDGRVCGTFRRAQIVAPPAPTLSRRLRWFLVALVLVVGQGLTAREALAQVRKPISHKPASPIKKHKPVAKTQPMEAVDSGYRRTVISGETIGMEEIVEVSPTAQDQVYTYVEQMPALPSGGGIAEIMAYIQQHVKRPTDISSEGRVFVSFVVGKEGIVRDTKIVKGLNPWLDAETLRVIQALPTFTPGRQGGQPVAVSFTVPVTFRIE